MEESGHFMTLFYMEIEPGAGLAQWVRAGHEPALVYDPSSERFRELIGTGLPLGVDASFHYAEQMLPDLSPGSIIALGTDGVWETTDNRGRIFGKERFRRAIKEVARERATAIVSHVFDQIKRFSNGLPPQDDITLVIIKILTLQ
jgi:sigma-B regulation protein RsbU (phosphoserine phosphatase)